MWARFIQLRMIPQTSRVRLVKPVASYPAGTVATVVLVYPDEEEYEIEIDGWLLNVDHLEVEAV